MNLRSRTRRVALASVAALVLAASVSVAAGVSAPAGRSDDGTPVNGGTLLAGIPDSPDHLDPGLSYTNEGWEIFEATNDGLLTFVRTDDPKKSATIVPDIAAAMPTVSKDGLTYTFKVRTGVRFSPPVNRDVLPSDFKFTIERLFRINSGGVSFYTGIVGANQYAKTKKGGISGIVANDKTGTLTFHLTTPDGTFPDYLSIPFAFAVPKGTPDKDISTDSKWRIATGPYMISNYVPKQSVTIVRNPNFKQWTPNTPGGHLDGIDIKIGITPDAAVNMTADNELDWYFEPIASDRYTQLKTQYPDQVHNFVRNNVTYFEMNSKRPPFDKLAVRQAVNYAIDRTALVKIFGGQGTPTENILPPGLGSAYKKHDLYPLNVAKAKALVKASGDSGMAVTVWSHTTDPTPKAAQYMAGVLSSIGFKTTVKTSDESVYWDTISTQKGDPQIAFQDWNQDFPEGQDFIDLLLNGRNIVDVGNNNQSNTNVPAFNTQMNTARAMPLGAARNAMWAKLDYEIMKTNAPWAPFMNREIPKYVSTRVHGLVFNPSYFELFPSMWLSK
jgi:peptide/nickel transport system substrate-binding protein